MNASRVHDFHRFRSLSFLSTSGLNRIFEWKATLNDNSKLRHLLSLAYCQLEISSDI